MERLDKYVADRTNLSRNDVKIALKSGKIRVNDIVPKDYSLKINPEKDKVYFDGRELIYRTNIYIMLNKPEDYVCSTRDGKSETVISLIPETLSKKDIFPAGRLDKDSKGFVLLTDDGEFAHKILSPKNHLPKYYLVRLKEEYSILYEEKFESGMIIDGEEKCLPAKIKGISHDLHFALVELHEGKFHQVKRMFEIVGNHVESLFRVQIGGLPLDEKLAPGECLEILNNDVEKLLSKIDFTSVHNMVEKKFWSYLINNKL